MRKESPLQKKEKKNLLIRSKKQSDWEWRGMNCDSGSILWLFSMQRSIRKTGFHETWWSRGFTSILSKGRWGEGGTCIDAIILSAARIFRRLRDFPLLADLDLFSARNFRSAVRVNPPSLDATSARPPVSPQFRRTGYRPFLPPRYLFIDGFASCTEREKRKPVMHAGSLPTIGRKNVEKLRLGHPKLFETCKVVETFFLLLLYLFSVDCVKFKRWKLG